MSLPCVARQLTGYVQAGLTGGMRRFKCLTLNVLASPVPFNRMQGERLDCLLRQIAEQQYDVVAFQELQQRRWHGALCWRYAAFEGVLRDLGYSQHVAGPMPGPGNHLDGGTAIFSKHRIVASGLHPWRRQVSWDSWAAKGVVHAQIEVAPPPVHSLPHTFGSPPLSLLRPVRLHIFTLHAQASHSGWQNTSGEDSYRRIRIDQMKQFAEVVRSETSDGEAVLALGDFNFNARDERELLLHHQSFAHGTGRNQPPIDVLAASFNGDHPATFGDCDDAGLPLETFLTNKSGRNCKECLDHVYYWPAETSRARQWMAGLSGMVAGTPRCSLERFPYTGPADRFGRRPTQVSDHAGWTTELQLSWPSFKTAAASQDRQWPPIPWALPSMPPPVEHTHLLQRLWQQAQGCSLEEVPGS